MTQQMRNTFQYVSYDFLWLFLWFRFSNLPSNNHPAMPSPDNPCVERKTLPCTPPTPMGRCGQGARGSGGGGGGKGWWVGRTLFNRKRQLNQWGSIAEHCAQINSIEFHKKRCGVKHYTSMRCVCFVIIEIHFEESLQTCIPSAKKFRLGSFC